MAGIECIGPGYKELLATLITRDVAKNVLTEVLGNMPLCEPMPTTLSAEGQKQVEAARKKGSEWNVKVDYTDEKGVTQPYDSPSGVLRALDLKVSGAAIVCDGVKCTPLDVVDIMRLSGYVVACEDEKGFTLDCKKASAGGKAVHVMHPAVLTMKAKAAGKLPEQIRQAIEIGRTWKPTPKSE